MSRCYDSSTTIFNPDGRVLQVEYAINAINAAGTCVGIKAQDAVILAVEKKQLSVLLAPTKSSEKMSHIDDHICCVVAGLSSDANILINQSRLNAARYTYQYQEPMPVEQLVQRICDYKQAYTQYGGLRPFGVGFLFAGWDKHHGFQLYQSDPSGNYSGWLATTIGEGNPAGKSLLKSDFEEGMSQEACVKLAAKVLSKTMDSTAPSADKMEIMILTADEATEVVSRRLLSAEEVGAVLEELKAETAAEGDA